MRVLIHIHKNDKGQVEYSKTYYINGTEEDIKKYKEQQKIKFTNLLIDIIRREKLKGEML